MLVEEGERQGLNAESIANTALLEGIFKLLKRDGAAVRTVDELTKR